MEAVPRMPMLQFDLKVSPENAQFRTPLKQYIASFYNEDPESYNVEINNLESLRSAAVRPTVDVQGCQLLKKYYCQLHFLKSRFPMAELQPAAVYFTWKDTYTNMPCAVPDIRFEMMCILYNVGALHSQMGALDSRTNPEGMKMACTHFQCAAWAFQTVKEVYNQMVHYMSSIDVVNYMQTVCLAQAQECILEKSMMDNRKATIIAKVAVQVVDYYRRALSILQSSTAESSFTDLVGGRTYKEWIKYLSFKVSYHKCIALLFQGQQSEEQQKMGERVAFYQAACEQLEEARKLSSSLKQQKDIAEALAFTSDVVEGKRKAAKNENEFIYHVEVPERHALQEVKGASLVKGIPFSITDPEVSGPDIFARLVPMEAHEAASLYSEKKAQLLRQLAELVETKDQALAEFMSSLQLDVFTKMNQATGLPQELVDRAAALSARPAACQDLVEAMGRLSNSYHDVDAMLNEMEEMVREEEKSELEYQGVMGKRPPGIVATDLARETSKYKEAHTRASDSNQTLHKAMLTHVANLKILARPLLELQKEIPCVELPNSNVDEKSVKEIDTLVAKVEEMRSQRAMLWAQLRESVHKDDITSSLVTRTPDQPLDQIFQQGLQKHQELAGLIEQNAAAQENILKALVDAYARSTPTRRYLNDVITKRSSTISALISSYDMYEDLLSKATKGVEFYTKLATNVSKLHQRIKSTIKVQQEEREQMLKSSAQPTVVQKNDPLPPVQSQPQQQTPAAPKLKDFLDSRKKSTNPGGNTRGYQEGQGQGSWLPAVRPAPLGSEFNDSTAKGAPENASYNNSHANPVIYPYEQYPQYQYDVNDYLSLKMSGLRADCVPKNNETTVTTDTYRTISSAVPDNQQQPYSQGASNNYSNSQANYNSYYTNSNSYGGFYSNNYVPGSSNYTQSQQTPASYADQRSTMHYGQSQPSTTGGPDPSSAVHNPPPTNYSDPYAYTHQYSQNVNVYYPVGYNPNPEQQVQTPTDSPNVHHPPQQFGTPEYATSVQPHVTNLNSSTYSSPVSAMKSSDSNGGSYYPPGYGAALPSSHNNNYPSYYYENMYNTNSGYNNQSQFHSQIQAQPQSQSVDNSISSGYGSETQFQAQGQSQPQLQQTAYPPPSGPIPVAGKGSNLDLLTGLDFTVSQAPLIPSQEQKVVAAAVASVTSTTPPKEEVPVKIRPKERIVNRKPLSNGEVKKLFQQEVDKFEKFVEVLCHKTLSGPTNLDLKWKEVQDKQESATEKKAISVARCYPMKNRFPDILPYDHTRVELKSAKDDYINASHIHEASYYSPPFIVTQAPLQATFADFWTMIKEQQTELIVCLLGDNEINSNEIYWPTQKGSNLSFDGIVVALMNVTVKSHWTERLISVTIPEKRDTRVIMHLQFTSWPGSLFPSTPDCFVGFVTEVINMYLQQRNTCHAVVVHCAAGIGRSGLACLLVASVMEATNNPTALPDFVNLVVNLSGSRRNILRDREHLKFAYEAFLSYMKQLIFQGQSKRTLNDVLPTAIITSGSEEKASESKIVENIDVNDPLNSLDPFWASKKGSG